MKALFLIFHGFEESNGISKKIRYQVNALKECGLDVRTCYYDVDRDGHRKWMIDDDTLKDFGNGSWAKIKKRFCFGPIVEYTQKEKIDFVYIRSYHNANPFTIHFVKALKKTGAKVVMEIPTYPYDQEYITRRMKLDLFVDKCFRHRMAQTMDAIVTFSNAPTIFGQHTIRISNGIDFSAIRMKNKVNDTSASLHLIGVAEIHYWHGFDRLIQGLVNYYKVARDYKVYFHIVGNPSGEREVQEVVVPVRENHLEEYVIMHGAQHGEKLDTLFNDADMGIGSLGRHRSNITYIKTLKNREYAARGIPFTYSEMDSDFDTRPYVLKVLANEEPIDIDKLIAFYHSEQWVPTEIRESIKNLSWKEQMQIVIDNTFAHE